MNTQQNLPVPTPSDRAPIPQRSRLWRANRNGLVYRQRAYPVDSAVRH